MVRGGITPSSSSARLDLLARLVVEVGSSLDLEVTLRRVLNAAIELTGVRQGAVCVSATEESSRTTIHVGMADDTARDLAAAAVGESLRIDDVAASPYGTVLPARQPLMRALLAMPITVRGSVFATVYLLDDRPDRAFSEFDEGAMRTLAAAASTAIDTARLFAHKLESARWMQASREITTALVSADPQTRPLQLIVNRVLELAEAEQAILLIPAEPYRPSDQVDTLIVAAASGRDSALVLGQQVPMQASTTGGVVRRGQPLITDSFEYPIEGFTDGGDRPAIVMPLVAHDTVLGVIAVARHSQQPRFGNYYLDLVNDFARHAAIALALTESRERALNQELAQADTVAEAVHAAADVLRRLWRARRVLAVTFAPDQSAPVVSGDSSMASVVEPARWADLSPSTQQRLVALSRGDLLSPNAEQAGTAGIALRHPDGVLAIVIDLDDEQIFTVEDQTLLTVLAARLGQGLQRVHKFDQQRETALALQHAILGPAELPAGFAVRYQPASWPLQVGGDWYDVIELDDLRIAFTVGDCVGHGLRAATVMGQMRSASRALLLEHPDPKVVLSGLDRFAARLPGAQCTSAVCAVLDTRSGELVYSSAGHPPPILVKADGTAETLEGGHSIGLGLRPDRPRPDARIVIPARATLLLYTDGLVERRKVPLEHGISRATALLQDGHAYPLDDLADALMAGLAPTDGFQDDVAVLLYRHPAPLGLTFSAHASRLADARTALRTWLTQARVKPEQTMDVLIAAGEAVTNAIEHAYRDDPSGTVTLDATASADRLELTITDTGSWKGASPVPNPHRGRGISLMRALMHDVTIDAGATGTTIRFSAKVL